MLLKHLYDFAQERKLLEGLAFTPKPIRWVIPIDGQGHRIGQGLIQTEGEQKRGKEFSAPKTSLPKDTGGIAEFLADGLTAVFGFDGEPEKDLTEKKRQGRDKNNAAKCEHFWAQVRDAYEQTKHSGLFALLQFHQQTGTCPAFLRYGPKTNSTDPTEKLKWWVKTAQGEEVAMGNDQFTFQVDGQLLLLDESAIRPYWQKVYTQQLVEKDANSSRGLCLVTGNNGVPIATTHLPKIMGIRGAQSTGAAVVSFDKASFTSYGFEQSLNAPVSTEAVTAYCAALNELLRREDHSLNIGETTLCFWARQSESASGFIARMLRRPDPKAVSAFLKSPWAGIDRQLAQHDQFYSITLTGNGGRVVVRHWMQSTVEQAQQNLFKWFSDLEIVALRSLEDSHKRKQNLAHASPKEETEKIPPLALFLLAVTTVRDAKDLLPSVPQDLYRAALEGTAPSPVLVKQILQRLDADLTKNGASTLLNLPRFALLRLIINRNRKEGEPMIEPKVFDTDDQAYNCGRLLAVLSEAQAKAHNYKLEGAGVAERYFGTSSVSPSSVFPVLLRLNRHHLEKIKKSDRYAGHERYIEADMGGILTQFQPQVQGQPPQFPRNLNLQEQGRFAIGFYQQKALIEAGKRDHREKAKANEGESAQQS